MPRMLVASRGVFGRGSAMGMTVLLMLIHSNPSSLLQQHYMFSATSTDRG